jgi:CubicO group peptidase (beta-lactamase class C family)
MMAWAKSVKILLLFLVIMKFALRTTTFKRSPAKPFPSFSPYHDETSLADLRVRLDEAIKSLVATKNPEWDINESSFAVQLTSVKETIWSGYHTAPNTPLVTENTVFRIASISKTFTVYALLLQKDIHLDFAVTDYLPELATEQNTLAVNWSDVTVEMLASHLSGISRDTGGSCFIWRELMDQYDDHELQCQGFPPPGQRTRNLHPQCNLSEILRNIKHVPAVFPPASQATYSNIAFSLVGAIIERSTKRAFVDVLNDTILMPLSMRSTRMSAPEDLAGAVPGCPNDWSKQFGADIPTAGLYSTASDLSIYIRSILGAQLLPPHKVKNWLKPHSWTQRGTTSAYGIPWEILRTSRLTPDARPIEIVSKGGSLRGYYSSLILIPEFGIGFSILTAAPSVKVMEDLRELLTKLVVSLMDEIFRKLTRTRYAGVYSSNGETSGGGHSSVLELEVQRNSGLTIKKWISNGTDFLQTYASFQNKKRPWEAQLLPTGVIDSTTAGQIEYWRLDMVDESTTNNDHIWADAIWTDIDDLQYAGKAVGEFGFLKNASGDVVAVIPTALGTNLRRVIEHAQSLELDGRSEREL